MSTCYNVRDVRTQKTVCMCANLRDAKEFFVSRYVEPYIDQHGIDDNFDFDPRDLSQLSKQDKWNQILCFFYEQAWIDTIKKKD